MSLQERARKPAEELVKQQRIGIGHLHPPQVRCKRMGRVASGSPLAGGMSRLDGDVFSDVLLFEDLSQQKLPARSLAAALQRAGLRAELIHFGPDQDAESVVALALRAQPRLIAFSILFADRVAECFALITALRQVGVRAHTTMVGPLPTFAAAELLAACPELDSVLCGEAETSVVQLAAALCHSEPRSGEESLPRKVETLRFAQGDNSRARWQTVPGLVYRVQGQHRHGTPAEAFTPITASGWVLSPASGANPGTPAEAFTPITASLDELPFPVWDDGLPSYAGYGFATVEGSRGCYHACTFCLPCAFYRAVSAPYRLRSVPTLVDEMEALYQQGVRLFLFDDEQFLPPGEARKERVQALGHELERRRMDIAFTIKCRADDVQELLFQNLKDMGLVRVYIGVESGCKETLDVFGKGVTPQRNAEALATLDELGIVADFRSLLLHPWSRLETIQADLDFLQRVLPHAPTLFSFCEVEVYPGTPLAARLKAEGRGGGDPWPLPYAIADPRAELVRRVNRIVFSTSNAYARLQDAATQAWYALLLRQRFEPGRFRADQAHKLKALIASVNRSSIETWDKMLAFARTGPAQKGGAGGIFNSEQVNDLAGSCASRVNAICVQAQDMIEGMQI